MRWRPFLTDFGRDAITIFSLALTVLGFIVARSARRAARRATEESQRNYRRYVVANLLRLLDGAKTFVDSKDRKRATLRLGDLADQAAQLADLDGDWTDLASELRRWEEDVKALAKEKGRTFPADKWTSFILRLQTRIHRLHGPFKGPDAGEAT